MEGAARFRPLLSLWWPDPLPRINSVRRIHPEPLTPLFAGHFGHGTLVAKILAEVLIRTDPISPGWNYDNSTKADLYGPAKH